MMISEPITTGKHVYETRDCPLPHFAEDEQALLGSILQRPDEVMADLRGQVVPELFYDFRNRKVWECCSEIVDAGEKVDELGIIAAIKRKKLQDQIGSEFVMALQDRSPSSHNWPMYLERVRQAMICRQIIHLTAEFQRRAFDGYTPTLLEDFEKKVLTIRMQANPGNALCNVTQTQKEVFAEYENAMTYHHEVGIRTGFEELDNKIGGLKPQELIVLAGNPSSGKTSFALGIAAHLVLREDVMVGMASLETSAKKILHRANCTIAGVNGAAMLNGQPVEGDFAMLMGKQKEIFKFGRGFMLCEKGGMTIAELAAMFRRMYQKGARCFVVDYLQLLRAGPVGMRRLEEMTQVSIGLKGIAKELNCPLIALSSLNRKSLEEGRPPRMSDLRESGQLEFDADVCVLLHPKDTSEKSRTINVIIGKNKDGWSGNFDMTFYPRQFRFEKIQSDPGI